MEKRTIKKMEILIFVGLISTVIVSILLLPENALNVFSVKNVIRYSCLLINIIALIILAVQIIKNRKK